MDKKQALKILIEHSFLLDDGAKAQLVFKLDQLTDAEVETLGKLLAEEKKQSLESIDKKMSDLNLVIEKLNNYLKKT